MYNIYVIYWIIYLIKTLLNVREQSVKCSSASSKVITEQVIYWIIYLIRTLLNVPLHVRVR